MRATALWTVLGVVALPVAAWGQQAITTFHSIGLYWTPSSAPADGGCTVRYRPQGSSSWADGPPLWFDARNGECRGSLVLLVPATTYEIELGIDGSGETASLEATTWSEDFPVGETVTLPEGVQSEPLHITEGGTADGYRLFAPPDGGSSTIDVADAQDSCVVIEAPYVIVRGLDIRGAARHAIEIGAGAHHVVLERNDISGWGRLQTDASPPDQYWGYDYDAAVHCRDLVDAQQIVVQRNRIHDPRSGSNSWAEERPAYENNPHPAGPQAVSFESCGGNNVFRYNEVTSDAEGKHWYNDGLGGWSNFSTEGFPRADSDIYGNIIANYWDDAIESEGGNRNVRIWGNFLGEGFAKVAIATSSVGPHYIWRNVTGKSRYQSGANTDDIERGPLLKAGAPDGEPTGGRVYLFHNTMLQPPPEGDQTEPLGAGNGIASSGGAVVNLVSRNNIFHSATVWNTIWCSSCDTSNDFDYDLISGAVTAYDGAEPNAWTGIPTYDPANGPDEYALAPESLGFDVAQRLAGFNDGFIGDGPDVGAQERGAAPLEFGVEAGTSAGGSAGAGGGGTGATGAQGGAGTGAQGGTSSGTPASSDDEDGGCGCRIMGRTRRPAPLLSVALLLTLCGVRRRRAAPGCPR